jgi:hypothetical protein
VPCGKHDEYTRRIREDTDWSDTALKPVHHRLHVRGRKKSRGAGFLPCLLHATIIVALRSAHPVQ